MPSAKTIEMSAESESSFQDAAERGVQRANQTLDHVQGIRLKDQGITLEDGNIKGYKVYLMVTFQMND